MPELPEVEVIRRGLMSLVIGRQIQTFRHSGKPLRQPVPMERLRKHIGGATINDVRRRAKYLLFPTDRGDLLIIHLGMTGKLAVLPVNTPAAQHDHLVFQFDNHQELRYNDTRRFGSVHVIPRYASENLEETFFRTCGPEPFSPLCTSKYFKQLAKGRVQPVKNFIMNSKIIVGVGNIYANESLFAAGIHPQTPAGRLTHKQWQLLIDKIREILLWAIDCGGSSISDFLNAAGQQGYFQINFQVYGRDQQPCRKCSSILTKSVIGGRASYYCPCCQKRR